MFLMEAEKGLTSGCPGTDVPPFKKGGKKKNRGGGRREQFKGMVLNCAKGHAREHDETASSIPLCRCLLFQLSEDITKDELKSFKFLLGKELPKCRLNPKTVRIYLIIFFLKLSSIEATGLL